MYLFKHGNNLKEYYEKNVELKADWFRAAFSFAHKLT